MSEHDFLAFDFGAETGRAIQGTLHGREKLELKVLQRFETGSLSIQKHYYWNIFRFYEEIVSALVSCVKTEERVPVSIGINSWGADFGLLGSDGSILRLPFTIRDPMTETSMPAFLERMSRKEIHDLTGTAIHKYNTVYQLYAMIMASDPLLIIADKLLFIPDMLNYMLSGEIKCEFTSATTSQLYNPHTKDWEKEVFRKLGIPVEIMPEIIMPGKVLGTLNDTISRQIEIEGVKVIATSTNETSSAVAAIPDSGDDWVYLSSGIWSLMGVEVEEAIIDQRSLLFNFTNEGGADGKYRFQKNMMGLWLLQQCKQSWEMRKGKMEYAEIIELARHANPFSAMIDPNYAAFYNPLDMPASIDTFCRQTNQYSPSDIGSMARTVLEALALKYRMVMEQLELCTNRSYSTIHIIGGGIHNQLLCQFAANATGRRVIAGPVEATGIGNIMMQTIAQGFLEDISEGRKVVMNSFSVQEYVPEDIEMWEAAYDRFKDIAKHN